MWYSNNPTQQVNKIITLKNLIRQSKLAWEYIIHNKNILRPFWYDENQWVG